MKKILITFGWAAAVVTISIALIFNGCATTKPARMADTEDRPVVAQSTTYPKSNKGLMQIVREEMKLTNELIELEEKSAKLGEEAAQLRREAEQHFENAKKAGQEAEQLRQEAEEARQKGDEACKSAKQSLDELKYWCDQGDKEYCDGFKIGLKKYESACGKYVSIKR